MSPKVIAINLFGACTVRGLPPHDFAITGAKHRALFALLATAPFGRRTRSFVQEALWGAANYETGRQSLRRALADIKALMGPSFGEVIASSHSELALDLTRVQFVGRPRQALFLEGIEVRTPGFMRWLQGMRENPAQLDALYSPAHQPSPPSVLPGVAVIPFRSPAGAAEHAVLGDWLAEEICRSLSRSHLLAVISHLSCRRLAPDSDLETIRERLGTSYCVTGSLRSSGSEMVFDVDFIDVATGRLLWTRPFAAPVGEFIDRSARAIGDIVQAVGRTIADEALAHVGGRTLNDVEDHRLVIAGVGLMHRPALRDFARARTFLEEAARRAPRTPEIHGWLGKWYVLSVFNDWSVDIAGDMQRALDCTARGLDMSPNNSFCLTIDGFAQTNLFKRMDIAGERYELALRNNPNESLSWLLQGALLTFQDDAAGAVEATTRARRLSPIDPFGYFYDVLAAGAYFCAGDYRRALDMVNRSIAVNDRHISALRIRASSLHYLGRADEARRSAEDLLRRQPHFTLDDYRRMHPAADSDSGKRVLAALKAAGVP